MSRRLKLGLVRKQGKGGKASGYWMVEKRFPNLQKAVLRLFKEQGPESSLCECCFLLIY